MNGFAESTSPATVTNEEYPWTHCSFPERRPELVVKCQDGHVQLLLTKHVWPYRQVLSGWRGGYVNRTGQAVEKGEADAAYVRFTPAFHEQQVADYLSSLENTVMCHTIEGVVPASLMEALQHVPRCTKSERPSLLKLQQQQQGAPLRVPSFWVAFAFNVTTHWFPISKRLLGSMNLLESSANLE